MQVEGDQSVIGGGRICSSTTTQVLQADVDPTDPVDSTDPVDPTDPEDPEVPGTPVPTEPATPGTTPTATPGPDEEPVATSPVTGLPSTGQGNGAGSSFGAVLTLVAASLLMAAAIGMRTRSRSV